MSIQTKLLAENNGLRTFALILETDDEVTACLKGFAKAKELSAAQFTGIGAFSEAVLAYFDWETKDYLRIPVGEQVEMGAGGTGRGPRAGLLGQGRRRVRGRKFRS